MLDANLIAYLTFTTILAATPGSTTAVVVRNTLRGGYRAGLAAAVGAAVANCAHALFAGLGLSMLLAGWPIALVGVRFAGAAFLAGMGIQSLWMAYRSSAGGLGIVRRGASLDAPDAGRSKDRPLRAFREGLALNLANLTIISFYIAVVPTFIPAGASRWYFPLLAGLHITIALACHSAWALAFHSVRQWFASAGARRVLSAATGLALIFLAARVLR